MDPRYYWREVLTEPEPRAPLGRSTWKHVHEDGSEHDAELTAPTGTLAGLVGTLPAGARLTCRDCGATYTQGGS